MSFFKRPATHYGKASEPETPYQKAAQVWDERIGSARVQAKNWRLMAFGSLILSAGFASALGSSFAGALRSASTAPGSRSGRGGGGSSGGGGGGGGGGGR